MAPADLTPVPAPDQDPKVCGVYSITCLATGKIYIGSAKRIRDRWYGHRSHLNRDKHDNVHLQRAWNKHGEEGFEFRIVEIVPVDRLIEREQHWIDWYDATDRSRGFNLCPRAYSCAGVKRSAEFKSKLSVAFKGKKHSPERCANSAAARLGKPLSDEHKAKLSESRKGLVHSPESRAKLSAALKGKTVSPESRAKMSAAQKGKKRSDEYKAKMSAVKMGKTKSLETRARMSAAQSNRSPETRAKISAHRKAYFRRQKEAEEQRAACSAGKPVQRLLF